MKTFKKGKYRQMDGYLTARPYLRNSVGLDTSGSIDDELWTLIEHFSEIESVGISFLKRKGIANTLTRKKIYKHFQAHIRQAKSYYYSARLLAPRSSGLLYYYCFLNLVKAELVIKDPTIAGKPDFHGLKYKIDSKPAFSKQTIIIKNDGIFPKLYEWYFGKRIKPTQMSISVLLNYCSDIGYQRQMAGIDKPRILSSYFMSCTDKSKKTAWALIAVPQSSLILEYQKSFTHFLNDFEVVDVPQMHCREMFHMDAYEQSQYRFFQSTKEIPWITDDIPSTPMVIDHLHLCLVNSYQSYYFKEGADFSISLPYLPNKQVRMDETIAIYLIMYYLSNLVRYKPQYLEGLLSTKESWLIESFTRSCSITFLRSMISRIIGTEYILSSR